MWSHAREFLSRYLPPGLTPQTGHVQPSRWYLPQPPNRSDLWDLSLPQSAPCPQRFLALMIRHLSDVEQSMGLMHNGTVYALWDYSAEFGDELSFREGDSVTVLRKDGPEENDWWWATLHGQEGYVPRNYFGVSPEEI